MNKAESLEEEEDAARAKDEETALIADEITECFAVFDQSHAGQIPSKYLRKALDALGIKLCDFELDEAIEVLEKNGTKRALQTKGVADFIIFIPEPKFNSAGTIEFKDFFDYAAGKLKSMDHLVLAKQAFSVFDKEGEGFVATDRLKKWMTTLGDQLTESEAKELCKMGDASGKGIFSYDDVAAMFFC